jgi:hypothetical protein
MPPTEKKTRGKYNPQFRWTEERLTALAAAYALLQGQEKPITAMARQIAADNHWPYRPVLNKLYLLRDKQRAGEVAREKVASGD